MPHHVGKLHDFETGSALVEVLGLKEIHGVSAGETPAHTVFLTHIDQAG